MLLSTLVTLPRASALQQPASLEAAGGALTTTERWAASVGRHGSASGMRLFSEATTPPIAVDPYRSVAGPRITSTWLVLNGSIGTKWSSPRSEAPPPPMPFSVMPTRLTSRPRTIGRLDAPGAKLDPVTPGLLNRRSPSVELPLRLISSLGTTVTVANWSVTTGNVPGAGTCGAAGAVGAAGAGAAGLATCFGCAGAGRRIGLGACTTTGGISTCAKTSLMLNDRNVVLARSSVWLSLMHMVIPQHRKRFTAL